MQTILLKTTPEEIRAMPPGRRMDRLVCKFCYLVAGGAGRNFRPSTSADDALRFLDYQMGLVGITCRAGITKILSESDAARIRVAAPEGGRLCSQTPDRNVSKRPETKRPGSQRGGRP